MKRLTCRELGGPCDEALHAESWDQLVKAMTAHVMSRHLETARAMDAMHRTDPAKWGRTMKPKWDAAPEV